MPKRLSAGSTKSTTREGGRMRKVSPFVDSFAFLDGRLTSPSTYSQNSQPNHLPVFRNKNERRYFSRRFGSSLFLSLTPSLPLISFSLSSLLLLRARNSHPKPGKTQEPPTSPPSNKRVVSSVSSERWTPFSTNDRIPFSNENWTTSFRLWLRSRQTIRTGLWVGRGGRRRGEGRGRGA